LCVRTPQAERVNDDTHGHVRLHSKQLCVLQPGSGPPRQHAYRFAVYPPSEGCAQQSHHLHATDRPRSAARRLQSIANHHAADMLHLVPPGRSTQLTRGLLKPPDFRSTNQPLRSKARFRRGMLGLIHSRVAATPAKRAPPGRHLRQMRVAVASCPATQFRRRHATLQPAQRPRQRN